MSTYSNPTKFLSLIEDALHRLPVPEKPHSLYEPIRYTLNIGGKRLRPQLVLMGAGLTGGDVQKALPAALAVEMLHNFTLIHDDIMDDADSRRGQPTVHTKWNNTTAILSGDALFTLAYQQLETYSGENGFPVEVLPQLLQLFTKATQIVCEGQALDVEFETSLSVSLDDYLYMIGCKTAALLEASLKMGGVVAGASDEAIEQLGIIGKEAGLAFQIQDDLLDAIGDPDKFGKRQGGDIYEGKKTFLTILAMDRADTEDRQKIVSILQKSSCTETEVAYVIGMFDKLGVISDTQLAIKNRYITSLRALEHFKDNPYKFAIKGLLDKLTAREF